MFNLGITGNIRVNGFAPDLANNKDFQGQRKRKGRLAPSASNGSLSSTNGAAEPVRSSLCNGQPKFSDRVKGILSNGNSGDLNGSEQESGEDMEDPYTFSEPEPVSQYNNPSSTFKTLSKMSSRSLMKNKIDKTGNNSSVEPTGLNMTRLYPAISASLGHSFFDSNSTHPSSSPTTNELNRNSLASLLETTVSDQLTPKKGDVERTFSSFSVKELNCFPNLTSPPPADNSPPTIVTSNVSPVKHGTPSTPQRESNKLAALFSPTYLNSIRNDKTKLGKISLAKTSRDKSNSRGLHCDKRSNSSKEGQIKSPSSSIVDGTIRRHDDVSKTTVNRIQDKIARNKVISKHNQRMDSKDEPESLTGRHSELPVRRSLLEEQLLGSKPSKLSKREELSSSCDLTPPPSATTRVPGMVGPLTYGIARSTTPSSRPSAISPRHQKSLPIYGSQKSPKTQPNASVPRQPTVTYGPNKNSSVLRQTTNRMFPSSLKSQGKIDTIRPIKRARTKLDIVAESLKPETMQRLQSHKKADHDVFCKTTVVESDSDNSDLEEGLIYQKHWFSGWREAGSGLAGEERREGRLSQLRAELRRKLGQVWSSNKDPGTSSLPKCIISAAFTRPSQTAVVLAPKQTWHHTGRSKLSMLVQKQCVFGKQGEGKVCQSPALPCAHHCVRHITYNVDQQLFEHCTAKFSDNTQCCVPVFDSCHELPLCTEHARKLDNYNRMCQTTKPKRIRKKPKPSAMTRSSKRSKKKKLKPLESQSASAVSLSVGQPQPRTQRSQSLPVESLSRHESQECNGVSLDCDQSSSLPGSEVFVSGESFGTLHGSEPNAQQVNGKTEHMDDVVSVDVVEEEVLAMAAELPLDTVDLAQQASGLLEEHDLTNVLNQIPADAFNDLFIEDKNGEPTREETEELERALAAVDKDVKSLERMGSQILLDYKAQELLQTPTSQAQVFLEVDKLSQTHGLLDIDKLQAQGLFDEKNTQGLLENLLDDPLVQTLTAQLPADLPGSSSGLVYYHNGYAVTGSNTEKSVSMTPNSSSCGYGYCAPTHSD